MVHTTVIALGCLSEAEGKSMFLKAALASGRGLRGSKLRLTPEEQCHGVRKCYASCQEREVTNGPPQL